jgi:hypothetical protein
VKRRRQLGVMSSEEPRCNQTRQSCRELRGCAGHISMAHVREQRKFNREQEDLEVRGGVGLANQFGSIVSSHDPRHLATSALRHPWRLLLRPSSTTATFPGKLLCHSRNLVTVELFSSPNLFTAGIHFPHVLLHNQGYPKVCPVSLNLLNAGNPFAGISSLTSCYLFSRTRDLIALV